MNLRIADTNVLIDLYNCGALHDFLKLPIEVQTLDLVIAEIKEESQRKAIEAAASQIIIWELSEDDVEQALHLPTHKNLKRLTDKAVLLKALQFGCGLLTGDKDMRSEAEARKIEVHGSLWALRQMLNAGTILKEDLLEMLARLAASNPRLPIAEIQKLNQDIHAT